MSQYAMVNGVLAAVTKLGERGRCHDPKCAWEMFAKPGNGRTAPHWAHKPGSQHIIGTGEKGEWHLELQNLFALNGAQIEVEIGGNRADVVLADGRVVEAQTGYLDPRDVVDRERSYGEMCWIWDAHGDWLIPHDTRRWEFTWGKPDRRFLVHTKPIYLDCRDGFYRLDSLDYRFVKGNKGRPVWEGRRTRVAVDLLEFVLRVSAGEQFGSPPRLASIDPRVTRRGTRARPRQDPDEWLAEHPTCFYDGVSVEVLPESSLPVFRVGPIVPAPTEDDPHPEPTMWAWAVRVNGQFINGFSRTQSGARDDALRMRQIIEEDAVRT